MITYIFRLRGIILSMKETLCRLSTPRPNSNPISLKSHPIVYFRKKVTLDIVVCDSLILNKDGVLLGGRCIIINLVVKYWPRVKSQQKKTVAATQYTAVFRNVCKAESWAKFLAAFRMFWVQIAMRLTSSITNLESIRWVQAEHCGRCNRLRNLKFAGLVPNFKINVLIYSNPGMETVLFQVLFRDDLVNEWRRIFLVLAGCHWCETSFNNPTYQKQKDSNFGEESLSVTSTSVFDLDLIYRSRRSRKAKPIFAEFELGT